MPSIVVLSGVSKGNHLSLEPRAMTVGRDERCDMQVLDERVSRTHIQVTLRDDAECLLKDVSSNGVFVNGNRVNETAVLRDNDVVAIGDSTLIFTAKEVPDQAAALTFAAHGEHLKQTLDPGRGGG